MILAWCIASTLCAAGMFLVVYSPFVKTMRRAKLWGSTLLLLPGQVMPPVLLWLAWSRTYYVIPFLGPPIRVGMAAVWWACAAVVLSYAYAIASAWSGQWAWWWVVLHPYGTVRLLWHSWKARDSIR